MAYQYHQKIECDHFTERAGGWKDICSIVSRVPTVYKEKSAIPLWSFYTLRSGPDVERARDGRHMRACSGNVLEVMALQIDYDEGTVCLEDFVRSHQGLQFAAYTSPGHKDSHPKFRVIIPLAKPLLNRYLMSAAVRRYLLDFFPGCDQTTINTFRKQRMPAAPLGGDRYRCWIGEGERLALDMAHIAELSTKAPAATERVEVDEDVDVFSLTPAQLELWRQLQCKKIAHAKELKELKDVGRGAGRVHYALTRIAVSLHLSGLGDLEAYFEANGWGGAEVESVCEWARNVRQHES